MIFAHFGSKIAKSDYGDSKYSDFQNLDILNLTITFIIDSKRFDCSLL